MSTFFAFLEPMDVALFRDNRPFSPQEGFRATNGHVIPPQSVVYGALRTMLLRRAAKQEWPNSEAIGVAGAETSGLQLGPVWLARQKDKLDVWMPCPADLVEAGGAGLAFQSPVSEGWSNLPEGLVDVTPLVPRDGGWRVLDAKVAIEAIEDRMLALTRTGSLQAYLLGRDAGLDKTGDLVNKEVQTGIARALETGTVREGMLYSKEVLRPRNGRGTRGRWDATGYWTEILSDASEFPESEFLTLGGEARPFLFQRSQPAVTDWANLRETVAREVTQQPGPEGTVRFRLVLLSPGMFAEGWRPRLPELPGMRLRLLGSCVPRTEVIGGWDMHLRRPKAAKRMVPAGAVYFLEAKAEQLPKAEMVEQLLGAFWRTSALCAPDPAAGPAGWGVTLLGIFPYAK